jgi:hypothetical protein
VKNPALVALKEENAKRTGSAAKEIEPNVRKPKRKRLRKAVCILRISLSVSLSVDKSFASSRLKIEVSIKFSACSFFQLG